MKSSEEIKKALHEYIDNIDDEETLWMVHEDVVEYLKKNVEEEDGLTEDQEMQLEEAIRQADAGETMSLDEFKKKMSTWHSKDLTEEEISEIKIGLQQIQNGETVDWNEYLKATSRWHTK